MDSNRRIGLEETSNSTDNSIDVGNTNKDDECLNEICIKMSEKYNTLKTEYNKKNEELVQTTKQLEAAKEEIKKLNDRTLQGKIRKKLSKLENDKVKQCEEIQTLKQKLEEFETEYNKLLKENETQKKELEKRETELCQVHVLDQQIASQEKLSLMMIQIRKDMVDFKIGMEQTATEMSKEMKEMRKEGREEMADLKKGMEQKAIEIKEEMKQEINDLRKDLVKDKEEPPKVTMKAEMVESSPKDAKELSEQSDPAPPETDKGGSLVTGAVNSTPNVMYYK